MFGEVDDTDARAAVRTAVDSGLTTIDTAAIYGAGYSEQLLGEELSDRREELTYFTKVFPGNYRKEEVRRSVEGSLERLKTDRVELLYMHWPPGTFDTEIVPLEEALGEMQRLKEEGKALALGVSNFPLPLLKQAVEIVRIEALQSPYSMAWRFAEEDTIPFCREQGMSFFAYSPLAQGLLTGKIRPGHVFPEGDHRNSNSLYKSEGALEAITGLVGDYIRPIAERHGCTIAQVALAWCAAQESVHPVVGARNADQASQNAGAMNVQLTKDEVETLNGASASIGSLIPEHTRQWDWSDR